jgi:diguanylate cyclase (GGDEF)-like protein
VSAGARDATPDRGRELLESLHRLLYLLQPTSSELDAELHTLESAHGVAVYSELLFLLCHLRLEDHEAKRCWQAIVEHKAMMQERLDSEIDLRVALASYFLQINRKLQNPKIIEMKLFEETQASAYQDELTGLYNYRFFTELLRCEAGRAERNSAPLSLVMIDVDDFKPYNDENGHEAGNAALRDIARLLTENLYSADMAARYGGEEFTLILPSTSKQDAERVAEKIRAKVELHDFLGEETQPAGALTISLGIATSPGDARETGDLIRRADQAMYAAKAEGKNRVQLYGSSIRSYRRVNAEVEGSMRLLGDNPLPLTCINLSEGGLRFLADSRIEPGETTEVTLDLPGSHGRVSLGCRVIKTTLTDSGRYLVGSRITTIDPSDQRRLNGYINGVSP